MRVGTVLSGIALVGVVSMGTYLFFERDPSFSDHHDDGHDHGHGVTFAAGVPGDPTARSRTIEIAMVEHADGRMAFDPSTIEARVGEQVLFKIRNRGTMAHEMIVATLAENLRHAEEMKRNPDMEHADPNGIRLTADHGGEILWRFTKAGEFDFSCLIPGHREAGMSGKVVVR